MKYSIPSFIILLIAVSIMSSCKTKKPAVTDAPTGEPLYFLSKGACFGKCPVYTLTIHNDGIAEYKGANFTKLLGTYRKSITKEQMSELDALFSGSNFEGFKSNYESLLPDLQFVKVGYANADSMRIVSGKEDRPTELMTLQYALENIANEDGWELIEPLQMQGEEEPIISDDGSLDKSKFVIRHKPGTQVPQWFSTMRETYGMRLIDKVALPEGNGWLVTYATKEHSPEAMMDVLKADEAILSADFAKAQ